MLNLTDSAITQDDGIVYKRLYNKINETAEIVLKSDNPEYEPYSLNIENVFEVWKALGFISFDLPEPDELSMNKLHQMVMEMKKDMDKLKK